MPRADKRAELAREILAEMGCPRPPAKEVARVVRILVAEEKEAKEMKRLYGRKTNRA